ncbi:MAG: hypothetical protein IPK74_21150 [Deltaproteobacteria bacterium]|nr:hypothetical protein [Deltaproteobacteria bacterium]
MIQVSTLLASVLAIDPQASRVDLSGGVVAEVRGGYAPVAPNQPSQFSFLTLVTPNVDLRYRHRRGGTLTFGYAPRMLLRLPNILSLKRPLFLHQLQLSHAVALDRRWNMTTSAAASVGELDYTALGIAFNGQQTAAPQADVIQFAIGDLGLNFTGRLDARRSLAIVPSAGLRVPFNQSPAPGQTSFPAQYAGNLGLAYSEAVAPLDDVYVQSYQGVVDFRPGGLFVNSDTRVGWTRQVRRRLETRLDGGVFNAQVLAQQDAPNRLRGRVLPVGSFRLGGRLRARARYTMDGAFATGLSGFFDVLGGNVSPRATGSVQLTVAMPPRWTFGVVSAIYTAATLRPLPTASNGVPQTESSFLNQVPIGYRIDDTKSVEFGFIANIRTPHLASSSFTGTQLEAWLYVAFRIAGGTARGGREVTRRGVGSGQGANVGNGGVPVR